MCSVQARASSDSSYLRLERLPRRRVGRRRRQRLDPAGPHVGQELVGDLGQDVFGEPGHAQDVVPCPVDVVSERDELRGKRKRRRKVSGLRGAGEDKYSWSCIEGTIRH